MFCLLCRPTQLLQFLHDARQQLLRAAVLLHDTRKLPPLAQLVQPGGVLDIAANHARALQSAADELFRANGMLLWQRVPLFNVPDALDVLSTGEQAASAQQWCCYHCLSLKVVAEGVVGANMQSTSSTTQRSSPTLVFKRTLLGSCCAPPVRRAVAVQSQLLAYW